MLKTQVIGHIGRDCLVKEINGKTVINFSVAHTESYKNAEGVKIESTTWVECAYWSERTAIAQYLLKGTQIYAEGIPAVDTYQNDQGRVIPKLRLRVSSIQLLGTGTKVLPETKEQGHIPGSVQTNETEINSFNNSANSPAAVDDLPF